ncbi:hypothetical protein AVEN_144212-1 [Araneus ventricosus]|uniref:Uncharacterized protein n=1 Tax=Araneus ventricosus TaxID=182803 RepID=A0A4Y2HSX4_ARAVE|nr:hypothetical protein AVEN_144212-1 [Araneus ventricosus]
MIENTKQQLVKEKQESQKREHQLTIHSSLTPTRRTKKRKARVFHLVAIHALLLSQRPVLKASPIYKHCLCTFGPTIPQSCLQSSNTRISKNLRSSDFGKTLRECGKKSSKAILGRMEQIA